MNLTNLRSYRIFFYLADQKNHTADELAEKLNVSAHTIKNDIASMSSFFRECGVELESKRGRGYCLHVLDETLFGHVYENIRSTIFYNPNAGENFENNQRIYSILAMMLTAKRPLSIDSIAEDMFISRNMITDAMKQAKEILRSYNLNINTTNNRTPMVYGNEFDFRFCMIFLYDFAIFNDNFSLILNNAEDFISFFNEDKKEDNVRMYINQFRDIFEMNGYAMRGTNYRRMVRYCILSVSRIKQNYKIEITKEDLKYIQSFAEYDLAKRLVTSMKDLAPMNTEAELASLAKLLLIWNDLDADQDVASRYPQIYDEAVDLANQMDEHVHEIYNFHLGSCPRYIDIATSTLIPMLFQIRFRCAEYYRHFDKTSTSNYYNPFYCLSIVDVIQEVFQSEYDMALSEYNYQKLGTMINTVLTDMAYDVLPQRIFINSLYGTEASKSMASSITRRIPSNYISKINAVRSYEIKNIKETDYDLGITHQSEMRRQKHTFPIFSVSLIPTSNELEFISQYVYFHAHGIEDIYTRVFPSKPDIYTDIQFDTPDIFYSVISYKTGNSPQQINEIQSYLKNNIIRHYISDRICMIFLRPDQTKFRGYEVYHFDEIQYWEMHEVEYVIVACCSCNDSITDAKFFRDFFHVLATNRIAMETLCREGTLTRDMFYYFNIF